MQFPTRMAAGSATLLLSLLAGPRTSHAQVADSVRIAFGAPVRIRTRDGTEGEWQFIRASPEGLMLTRRLHGEDLQRVVPWSEAERVDTVARGRPSGRRMFAGALIGGLVGYGVAFVGATSGPCHFDSGGSCPGLAFAILTPAIVGTGVLTGAAVGLHHRARHWSTAWRAPAAPPTTGH
jgi:hypothetical protein